MTDNSKQNHLLLMLTIALAAWFLPGAGHFLLKENKKAVIIFATIVSTFCLGLYIGSIGVIDPVEARLAYAGQIMNSPVVAVIAHHTAGGGYPVYGRPNEIGQIYTSISGLLNLLCIINAVYLAHLRRAGYEGG